ncbi:MAG: TcfC E-set like domain-containing protein, partial [Gammaproteobacteria bacterium]|nr:TcfC E-set like domain-containing protein [Gammaproteobacteria bacterium]
LDTRADLAAADATPIYLYLAQRSRVDVYRDEQLLDSGFYDAGNQQLDTRNLPDGAYNLRVVINGADGREQELVFFFARTARLPPLDQPLYYLEAGLLSDDPNTIGTGAGHWVRGGTARRLTSTFGAQLEMTALSDEQFLQGGLFMLGQGWQLEAGLLSGTAGGTGASLRGAYRFGEGSLSFDYRNVSGHGRLLTQPFSQGTVSLSLPVFRGRLYGRAQVERRDNASANNLFGLNFRRPLLNRFGTIFDLDIAVSRDRTDTFVQVALEGRWRNRTRISTVRPHVDLRTGSQAGQSVLVDASTTYMARNTDLGDYSATVAVASELGNYTVSGGLLSQSGFGQFAAQMQHSDTHGTGFTANGRVSLLTADGRVGWGGRSQARAGLLVEIPGNSETDFDVIVDDQVVATAASGRVNVVGLRPYSSYEVRIEPRGAQLVEFDNSTKKVTLYPGNVASLQFEASTVTVVVGRLIGPTGEVVANARILGLGGFAGTDSRGWFQVEVPGSGTIDVRRADGSRCQVGLDVAGAADGIAMLGELVCR